MSPVASLRMTCTSSINAFQVTAILCSVPQLTSEISLDRAYSSLLHSFIVHSTINSSSDRSDCQLIQCGVIVGNRRVERIRLGIRNISTVHCLMFIYSHHTVLRHILCTIYWRLESHTTANVELHSTDTLVGNDDALPVTHMAKVLSLFLHIGVSP